MSQTDVIMVLDMSGSMSRLANDVRGGCNSYIEGLKQDKVDARVSITLFDTESIVLCSNVALDQVPQLTEENYMPRGNTALLDAIGRTISNFEQNHKLAADERVMVVVYTDGEENSSREWTKAKVNALIEEREATNKWVFIYLGAAPDQWTAEQYAATGGAPMNSTVQTPATSAGTRAAFDSLRSSTASYSTGQYSSKEEQLKDIETQIKQQQGNGGQKKEKETSGRRWPQRGNDS